MNATKTWTCSHAGVSQEVEKELYLYTK